MDEKLTSMIGLLVEGQSRLEGVQNQLVEGQTRLVKGQKEMKKN